MKKIVSIIVFSVLALVVSAQIHVATNGNVGVKTTTPGYTFDVNGTARINCSNSSNSLIFDNNVIITGYSFPTIRPSADWYGSLGTPSYRFGLLYCDHVITRACDETSDEKFKENIRDLEGALPLVVKLRPVRFDWKSDYYNVSDLELKNDLIKKGKNKIGFLAQEVKEIFPEIVSHEESTDTYSIHYTALIPVLVEAINEQQLQIDALKKQIDDLSSKIKN
jgi:hypothetical protein